MTIDLGYAWTTLPSGAVLGFVDVPGHARFIGNMLAGLGPAPAVLVVWPPTRAGASSPPSTSRRWTPWA
jgi:selenocysteine-specific translation elongation factor